MKYEIKLTDCAAQMREMMPKLAEHYGIKPADEDWRMEVEYDRGNGVTGVMSFERSADARSVASWLKIEGFIR